ncbi:DPP IV N-terminal domain-containing protein [Flagellimonas onchidii]|uniref:DPP IV N-terminal domain-containing protein n=1 Tax=Flagellimonas onchidii TaxID=2562684 RepID=UPI0010A5D481|nr:DPP IV N-terminal domain-containing protein [Allomuricauda onchidii]
MNKKTFLQILLIPCLLSGQVEGWKEECLTNNPADDRYASYSPDGNSIVFESNRDGNWEIYLMDSKGGNVERLTNNATDDRRPTWHPNGKKVLFESNQNGVNELYTIKIHSGKRQKFKQLSIKGEPIFAAFSPNGKRIAVSIQESEQQGNLVLLNKKGKILDTLIDNGKRNFYPKWSKDGSEIVFFSRMDTDNIDDEIYSLNLKSGLKKRLTYWHKHNFCPSWSADDTQIVYTTSMENTRPEIYIMNANGSNQRRITNNENGETLPNWHPSQNKILITAYRNGNYEICVLMQ